MIVNQDLFSLPTRDLTAVYMTLFRRLLKTKTNIQGRKELNTETKTERNIQLSYLGSLLFSVNIKESYHFYHSIKIFYTDKLFVHCKENFVYVVL